MRRHTPPGALLRRLLLLTTACAVAPEPPGTVDDTAPVLERCVQGAPCDVLPPRADPGACGAGLINERDTDDAVAWPVRLSDLGCFTDLRTLTPAPGVVPYTVVSPLWSDGAHKGRWLVLPAGGSLGWTDRGAWAVPDGTLVLKSFGYARPDRDGTVPIEVRAMLRTRDTWRFASWRWDDTLGDALQVDLSVGQYETLQVELPSGPADLTWWYPSLVGCEVCHRSLATELLGVQSLQLRTDVTGSGQVADQVVAMIAAGLVSNAPDDVEATPALPDPHGDASVPERARSWLHGQCAHCHQPDGFVSPDIFMDLRYDTPFADARLCNEPSHGAWGSRRHVIVDPGKPDVSLLVERAEVPGIPQMPPGTELPEREGIELVRRWIAGMQACP